MLLKVSEVAKRLNLSASKVYQLIEQNRLPHYRLDGTIRVSEEQLADFLDRAKQEQAEARPRETRRARPQLKHLRL
ncbi:MAG TPA: helix-turn-helix domain-containing protein [Pirellulales bacterium]|nr:helix-turn-helix domain-containing protein [Pirellulales bacterium]